MFQVKLYSFFEGLNSLLISGVGGFEFGDCVISVDACSVSKSVESADCVVVKSDHQTVGLVSARPTSYHVKKGNDKVSLERASELTYQVVSLLKCLLAKRMVFVERLTIRLLPTRSRHDRDGETTFGFCQTKTKSAQIVLYIGTHLNEMHLVGTLLHEIGHFLTSHIQDHHCKIWHKETCKLMAIIDAYKHDLQLDQSWNYQMCVSAYGPNCIKRIL